MAKRHRPEDPIDLIDLTGVAEDSMVRPFYTITIVFLFLNCFCLRHSLSYKMLVRQCLSVDLNMLSLHLIPFRTSFKPCSLNAN